MSSVILDDERVLVSEEIMADLNLRQGQTITPKIFRAILQHRIAYTTTEIELKKAAVSAARK